MALFAPDKQATVILSRSTTEAKNLMKRQTQCEILRRVAPQNDTLHIYR
ncbi:MAG: hypothetical protein HY267_04185 [Deltaproteobacteria bacterium]|nr:hypothetical protein [Deltaproteobacteria bacterium]